MTGEQLRDGGGVDFWAGGRESGPLLVIGSTRLGYEDVLLLVALVQVFTSAVRLYVQVSD
jgi:transcriptional regulator of heat shock response